MSVGGYVGYIKVRHLYRVLSHPSSCFALILCRIGAFDRSSIFMRVQVF